MFKRFERLAWPLLLVAAVLLTFIINFPRSQEYKDPADKQTPQESRSQNSDTLTRPSKPSTNKPSLQSAPNQQATRAAKKQSSAQLASSVGYQPKAHEKLYRALYVPNDYPYQDRHAERLQLAEAWDYSIGEAETTIAIIDTGFGLEHEDFWQRWYINEGEQGQTESGGACWTGTAANKQTNNCDDDANGYEDDWRGWDFSDNDNDPSAGTTDPEADGVFHATAVAGLAAATGNNDIGITGVNWQTKIMPLQALYDVGFGFTDAIVEAIDYAVQSGADVINLSLGSSEPDELLEAAILNAIDAGVVVIAAAGNDGCECLSYPANYPEVLSVGASTMADHWASFSSYGNNLDVVAPGVSGIMSTSWSEGNKTHDYIDDVAGTSLAAPLVSGLAAIIKSQNPDLTVAEVITAIADSADGVEDMNGLNFTKKFGYGRVNALAALQQLGFSVAPSPPVSRWPLYHLYKTSIGQSFHTTNRDRFTEALSRGYRSEITKLIKQH